METERRALQEREALEDTTMFSLLVNIRADTVGICGNSESELWSFNRFIFIKSYL